MSTTMNGLGGTSLTAFGQFAAGNFEMAINNQISRELNDFIFNKPGFIAMLFALDYMYDVPGTRFRVEEKTTGRKIQVDFRAAAPDVVSAPLSGANTPLTVQSKFSMIAGEMDYAGYAIAENIPIYMINRFEANPLSAVPYVEKISKAAADATLDKLNKDLWPTAAAGLSVDMSNTTAKGAPSDGNLMAVAFPVQQTVGDAAPTSNSHLYMGLQLSSLTGATHTAMAGLRGIHKGNQITVAAQNAYATGSDYGGLTVSKLRRDFIIPIRNRGGNADVGVFDSNAYDSLLQLAENAIRIDQAAKLDFGGETVRIAGLNCMIEPLLDVITGTGRRELMVLDSSKWAFFQKDVRGALKLLDIPGNPKAKVLQGYFEAAIACESPRHQGRATGVTG